MAAASWPCSVCTTPLRKRACGSRGRCVSKTSSLAFALANCRSLTIAVASRRPCAYCLRASSERSRPSCANAGAPAETAKAKSRSRKERSIGCGGTKTSRIGRRCRTGGAILAGTRGVPRKARHRGVDQPPGDRHARRQLRDCIEVKPSRFRDLGVVRPEIASRIFSGECDHKRVRKRPRLAREVLEPANLDADFLAHFAANAIL